jgi:uncharacterized SAM-binding protein YcdF (DUF218 family)
VKSESFRAGQGMIGALLGALIALGLMALGITDALKLNFDLLIPGAVVGAILGVTVLRPVLIVAAAAVVVLLAVITYTPIADTLAAPFVRTDHLPSKPPDAIAVLSGGTNSDSTMDGATIDRLLTGLELSRKYPGVPLIVSRDLTYAGGRPISDSADVREILSLAPDSAVVLFADSTTSTRVEALRMKDIARVHHWSRIALVTSPMHTRRACATFEAVGFSVYCVPAVSRSGPVRTNGKSDDRLGLFRYWVYEEAGTIKYRSAGWIR